MVNKKPNPKGFGFLHFLALFAYLRLRLLLSIEKFIKSHGWDGSTKDELCQKGERLFG